MRQRVVRVAVTAVAVALVLFAVAKGQIGSDLVVAVPVSSAEHVLGVARASVPAWAVWQRVILTWLVLAGLAALSLLAANLVARCQPAVPHADER